MPNLPMLLHPGTALVLRRALFGLILLCTGSAMAVDLPGARVVPPVSTPAGAAQGPLRILVVDDDLSDNNNIPGDTRLSPSDTVFRRLAAEAVGGDPNAWAVDIVKPNASGPGIDRLRKYSLILWYTGASYGGNPDNMAVLGIEDEKTVRRYLEEVGGAVMLFSPGYISKVIPVGSPWDDAKWPFLSEVLGIRGGYGLAQRFIAGRVKAADGAPFSVGTSAVVETQFSAINPGSATVLFTSVLGAKKGDQGTAVSTMNTYGQGRILYVGFTFENIAPAELSPAFGQLLSAARQTLSVAAVVPPLTPPTRLPLAAMSVQVTGTPTSAVVTWVPPLGPPDAGGATLIGGRPVSGTVAASSVTVERLVPNAAAVRLSTVWPDEKRATDSGPLTPGRAVTYRVTLTDYRGVARSAEAVFTPPLPKDPEHFSAAVQADGSIILSWAPVPGVTSYRITGTAVLGTVVSNVTEWRSPRLNELERRWSINSVYEPGGNLTPSSAWPTVATKGTSNAGLPAPTKLFLTLPNGAGSYADSLAHFRTRCIDAMAPGSLCSAAGFIRPTTNWEESFLSGDWESPKFIAPAWPIATFDDTMDLNVARRVNCSPPSGGTTVCWAPSYHLDAPGNGAPGAQTKRPKSLSLIIMGTDSAFFGSWEWSGPVLETAYGQTPETINFGLDVEHHYAVQGSLSTGAALDNQGRKGVPHACLSCHGGRFDAATGKVIGASLLPLVPSRYSRSPVYAAGTGVPQESMRRINQIILQSNPAPAIVDQVNALYNGAPNTPGQTANDSAVPAGWSQQQGLYRQVIGPYCASCHFAQRGSLSFRSWGNLLQHKDAVQRTVCKEFTMPHSEFLYRKFWTQGTSGSLPALLSTALGFQKCPE